MTTVVLALAGLLFCTWAVSLAGLAAVQDDCTSSTYALPCYRRYRYDWFIISFMFVVSVGTIVSVVTGVYGKFRQSLLALAAMVTLLYIQISDKWYTATNASIHGETKDRTNTMAAGTIMSATVGCLLVIALGLPVEEPAASAAVEGKAATAV